MKRKRSNIKLTGAILFIVLVLTIWLPIVSVTVESFSKNEYKNYFTKLNSEYNEIGKLLKVSILIIQNKFPNIYSAKQYFFNLLDNNEVDYENNRIEN